MSPGTVMRRVNAPSVLQIVALLLLVAVAIARAEDKPLGVAVPLDEVVVTGTKAESSQWEVTVPTQVIGKQAIEESSTIDLENVLGEVPGLFVRKNTLFGLGASTVRMQGADPNKVAILVDGRRFRGGIDGEVDLRDIPANNVQRIEIIRGPASSLYGSDAMAGVINIITRQGTPEPTFEAVGAWGSFQREFYAMSHGWQVGKVKYFLSGVHDEFRPFEQYGNISEQFSGENRDATQNRDQWNLRIDTDLNEQHGFTFFPSWQQQTNPESTNINYVLGGEWRWQTTPESTLTTWANRYGFIRDNDLVGFQEHSDYVDWEAESRWQYRASQGRYWDANLVTVGTRARVQTLDQTTQGAALAPSAASDPHVDASVWQVSPFLQSEVFLTDRWSVLVGSSFDVHKEYGLDVNPRGTVTYRPWDFLKLSGTVGSGFRAPDLRQLYAVDVNQGGAYALLGDPNLEPEKDLAFQFEAAVRAPGIDGFLTLFRHEFEELITFAAVPICVSPGNPPGCIRSPIPGVGQFFQTQNFAKATTQGLELAFEFNPLEFMAIESQHQPTVGIGYAFLDTENQNGIEGEDGKDLPFSPRHRVLPSVGWRHKQLGMSVRIWGEYEDDAFTDPFNSEQLLATNHWLWNFKVTITPLRLLPYGEPREFATAIGIGRHFQLFAQGENVFDQDFGPVTATGRLASAAGFLFGVQGKF